jgi:hypothetical protein
VLTYVIIRRRHVNPQTYNYWQFRGRCFTQGSVGQAAPRKGDKVYLTETPEGFRLTPYDPEFEKQMTLARQIMKKRREVLHELAK